jgi:hypothetical protein
LYFFPEPQGHGSLRPTFGWLRTTVAPSGRLALSIGDAPPACAPKDDVPKEPMLLWLAD